MKRVRLVSIGDIALGESPSSYGIGVSRYLLNSKLFYSWKNYLHQFKHDFLIGNFEGVISTSTTYPCSHILHNSMRIDPENVKLLSLVGFSHLSLANNHVLDHGQTAYQQTSDILKKNSIQIITGLPQALKVHTLYKGEFSIGIISMNLTSANMDPNQKAPALNAEKDIAPILPFIKKNKELFTHLICSIHWGDDYSLWPNDSQISLARLLVENGVDLILGHHPHNIQKIEIIDNSPVVYSSGSFCFENKTFATSLGRATVFEIDHKSIRIAEEKYFNISANYTITGKIIFTQKWLINLINKKPNPALNRFYKTGIRALILLVSITRAFKYRKGKNLIRWLKFRYG